MNAFTTADAVKCIGCRTCEVACIVTHQQNRDCASVSSSAFIPRTWVIEDDAFTTAVVCHQCEDASCADICPTHVTCRGHGYIFAEQACCIGCKSCMLACPFGAMNVVACSSRVQAMKRNLCWHRKAGPACVEAYPTSALQCIDAVSIQRQRLRSQPL